MKMNQEIKAQWVAALRSGEYKQGRHQLRSPDNDFCCLGVLCNLHAQAHPEIASKEVSQIAYMGAVGASPNAVVVWANLLTRLGNTVSINGVRQYLSRHNDQGRTFAQIADAIEEQL